MDDEAYELELDIIDRYYALIENGYDYYDACEELADEFGVSEKFVQGVMCLQKPNDR